MNPSFSNCQLDVRKIFFREGRSPKPFEDFPGQHQRFFYWTIFCSRSIFKGIIRTHTTPDGRPCMGGNSQVLHPATQSLFWLANYLRCHFLKHNFGLRKIFIMTSRNYRGFGKVHFFKCVVLSVFIAQDNAKICIGWMKIICLIHSDSLNHERNYGLPLPHAV
jgi:hypothetical protein